MPNKPTQPRAKKVPDKTPEKERFLISFYGLKIEADNPGWKTILIIILVLFAIAVFILLLQKYLIPTIAAIGTKQVLSMLGVKLGSFIKLFKAS